MNNPSSLKSNDYQLKVRFVVISDLLIRSDPVGGDISERIAHFGPSLRVPGPVQAHADGRSRACAFRSLQRPGPDAGVHVVAAFGQHPRAIGAKVSAQEPSAHRLRGRR